MAPRGLRLRPRRGRTKLVVEARRIGVKKHRISKLGEAPDEIGRKLHEPRRGQHMNTVEFVAVAPEPGGPGVTHVDRRPRGPARVDVQLEGSLRRGASRARSGLSPCSPRSVPEMTTTTAFGDGEPGRRPRPKTARATARRVAQSSHGSRPRRLLPRSFAARLALRRPIFHGRQDDGDLLPPRLSGAHAAFRERDLLSHRGGRARGWISPVLALPTGDRSGPGGLAWHLEHGVSRAGADRARRFGSRRRRGIGGATRVGWTAASPAVSATPRCVPRRSRSDA